ncbi:hypothetical protein M951_chr3185 (nucleomorph) [Lotharella oceanica]|uniref:Uncharacterized protein n=1 Tax=Lotharella oceanica TaxID=641309 RepID=A0A060DB21_9EUKA|nr:hypothetical protein M951_chr120 [Lotharella oceanica]AIB09690.1 hypothetical protein M951_chr1211 [Lotharella oceanica]AIB09723.1 hypothetical protein M951_chr220 [Lotharella oceanica]AIB09893.1 hypothetical protein M951_chr2201 [Lotharella oceanica]AIB09926.1 hypothetical protein M951_chr320 [Lotharella oceanica]
MLVILTMSAAIELIERIPSPFSGQSNTRHGVIMFVWVIMWKPPHLKSQMGKLIDTTFGWRDSSCSSKDKEGGGGDDGMSTREADMPLGYKHSASMHRRHQALYCL